MLTKLRLWAKLAAGASVVVLVVGPISYGVYDWPSFWVGVAAGLAQFVNRSIFRALVVRSEIYDFYEKLRRFCAQAVYDGVFAGVTLGFGVGLSFNLADRFYQASPAGFGDNIAKGLLIGLAIGFLFGYASLLGPLEHWGRMLVRRKISEFDERPVLTTVLPSVPLFIIVGVTVGLPLGLGEAFAGDRSWSVYVGLIPALIIGFIFFLGYKATEPSRQRAFVKSITTAPVFAVPCGLYVLFNNTPSEVGFSEAASVMVAATLGTVAAGLLGAFAAHLLRPMNEEVSPLIRYLWEMRWPVLLFAFSFSLLVLLFAGLYASGLHSSNVDSENKPAISGADPNSFSDLLYFSLMTATSLGEGETMKAEARWAQTLASIEVLIGFAWTLIVFAAILTYLQPRFAKVHSEEHNKTAVRRYIERAFPKKGDLETPASSSDVLTSDYTLYDSEESPSMHGYEGIRQFQKACIPVDRNLGSNVHYVYQVAKHDHTVTQYVVEHLEHRYYVTAIDLMSDGKVAETYITERGKLPKAGLLPKYTVHAWAEDDYYTVREAALILDKTSEQIRQMFDDIGAEYHGLRRKIPVRAVHDKMLPDHSKPYYHKAKTLLEAPIKVQASETPDIRDGLRNLEKKMKSLQKQMNLVEAQAQTTEQVRLEARKERDQLLSRLEEEIAERSRLQRELQVIRGSWWRRIGKTRP